MNRSAWGSLTGKGDRLDTNRRTVDTRQRVDATIGPAQPGEAARIAEVAMEPTARGSTAKRMWRTATGEDEQYRFAIAL
ncbi:MAG: hypothetical protein WBF65_09985 [Sphingopyxis granuli]